MEAIKKIIRKKELLNMLGLSGPTIWRMEQAGKFPRRLRLGGNSCGWLVSEIDEWIASRAEERTGNHKS